MKRIFGYVTVILAMAYIYAFQPMAVAEGWLPAMGEPDSGCAIIETVHDFQGVVPPQSQLTVRTCQLKSVFQLILAQQVEPCGVHNKIPQG